MCPAPTRRTLTPPSAHRPPAPRELPLSKAALASMILGFVSAVPLSLVFGFIGLGATANGTRSGRGFAWAGLAVGDRTTLCIAIASTPLTTSIVS